MFGHLVNKHSQDRIYEIVKDAVSIKCKCLTKALPGQNSISVTPAE